MRVVNSCIVQQIIDSEKTTVIDCFEDRIELPLSQVLVWRKRELHWVCSNEVGDGMQLVTHCDRPFMLVHMQQDTVVM
jgi:hypothetical protein